MERVLLREWGVHPFSLIVLGALLLLALYIVWGYASRRVKVSRAHKRPQDLLTLAALTAELIHLWKGC